MAKEDTRKILRAFGVTVTDFEERTARSCPSCVRIIHLDLSQAARFGQTGRS
jgi:hypothetical protein